MEKVSVKYQNWSTQLLMLILPFFTWLLSIGIFTVVQGQALGVQASRVSSFIGLFIGAIVVLLIAGLRTKIVNRYFLISNIYLIIAILDSLFPQMLGFSKVTFCIALSAVFIFTMAYSPVGFIGQQYEKRSNMIYASSILFGLLAIIAIFNISFGPSLSIADGYISLFVFEYALFRFVILYIFDEKIECAMISRISKVVLGFAIGWITLVVLTNILGKVWG